METNEKNVENNMINEKKKSIKWYDLLAGTFTVTSIISCCFISFISSSYFFMSIVSLIISILVGCYIEKKIKLIHLIVITILIYGILQFCIYTITSAQAKPIIYLYPEKSTKVNVSLGNPKLLTCTYPKYNENIGWNVIAEPSGNLKYANNGKNQNLYALYWEGKSAYRKKIEDDGFIVKGEDTIKFLEEKLAFLGLSEREVEEFIVYWLPRMENNRYNYIRFETVDEIDKNMPLNITPKPDTTIRVMMDWCEISSEQEAKALQGKIKEQKLESPERTGFVAVEWGGSEI